MEKLEALEKAFINDPEVGTIIRYMDFKSGDKTVKFCLLKSPPNAIRLAVYRLVSDLRNVLDQVVYAAWIAVTGNEPEKDTYFPFGGNEGDFIARVKRYIPESLWNTFFEFKAYPARDGPQTLKDMLSALSKVSGPNKHRLAIGVGVSAESVQIIKADGRDCSFPFPVWDSEKNELPLIRIHPGGYCDYNIFVPIFVSFHKTKPVAGCPIQPFASEWVRRVEEIVTSVERKTSRAVARN